jgi:excisionase family DNA binding protein
MTSAEQATGLPQSRSRSRRPAPVPEGYVPVPEHLAAVFPSPYLPAVVKCETAAGWLELRPRYLRDAVVNGRLPAVRIGGLIRIPTAALLDLLTVQPVRPGAKPLRAGGR